MDAKLKIVTEDIETNLLFKDIENKSNFSGVFDDERYDVIINKTILIKRVLKKQQTIVKINKNGQSSIEIIDENGSFILNIEVVEIIENNGMISLVYKIDDKINKMRIEFH